MKGNEALKQFFTPVWAAERIVEHYYPELGAGDVVFDLGCGDGRFLCALPEEVPAFGFEIDPAMASQARANSGRTVIEGCFTEASFPAKPTLVLGNPPYDMGLVNGSLQRAYEALDYGREVGLVLPVYFFQTADTVLEYGKRWTLRHELLPRNLFEGMSKPVMFARFIKERKTTLVGMFLFEETSDMWKLSRRYRYLFVGNQSSSHLWGEAVEKALIALGGQAPLEDIYREIEGARPSRTVHWKAQIRKVCQQKFRRLGEAIYGLHPKTHWQGQMALGL